MSGELTIGAVFGMFITIIIAVVQIAPALVVLDYTLDLNREYQNNKEDIMNGDTQALNEFMENRANDIKDMTIDEIERTFQNILLNGLEDRIKK